MKDIHQVLLIKKALEKQKEKIFLELAKINAVITHKNNLIHKMKIYLIEYRNEKRFELSKSVPGLFINLNHFTDQIESVIVKTEIEIDQLKIRRKVVADKLIKLDQKIDLMKIFISRNDKMLRQKEDRLEQVLIDDISATRHLRE